MEQDDCLLIIDELKGRREAKALGIKFTGTLGVIIIAKEKGIIKSVKEILELVEKTDFRISSNLISEAIRKSGE